MSKEKKKSILLVAYHYPPDASVGAKRITRLSNYLKRQGWDVGVLTVKEKYFHSKDLSVRTEGIRIYRTSMIKSARFAMGSIKKAVRKMYGSILLRSKSMDVSIGYDNYYQDHYTEIHPGARISWMRRFFLSLIWCPDDKQGWIPFAFLECLRLRKEFSIVYSSCPVFSVNLVLLMVKVFYRDLIWVAEFRDPWIKRKKSYIVYSALSDWLETKWEKMVIEKASRVIVVNEAMKKDFIERYPLHAGKIKVFYNGYDESELMGLTCPVLRPDRRKVTFLHAGSFYHGRDPSLLLLPLANLIHTGVLDKNRIQLRFLGDSNYDGKPISQIIEQLDISDIVSILNFLPQRLCMEEINSADVLILFSVSQPLQVPAKLYEYFAFRKRILALSTGGITDEIIKRTNTGISVNPKDVDGIGRAIMDLVDNVDQAAIDDEIQRFRTDNIFKALASEIESLEIAR